MAHCDEASPGTVLGDGLAQGESALILIGPEGDFAEDEIEAARQAGFTAISLGESRLRTETAALTAVAFASFINPGTGPPPSNALCHNPCIRPQTNNPLPRRHPAPVNRPTGAMPAPPSSPRF